LEKKKKKKYNRRGEKRTFARDYSRPNRDANFAGKGRKRSITFFGIKKREAFWGGERGKYAFKLEEKNSPNKSRETT